MAAAPPGGDGKAALRDLPLSHAVIVLLALLDDAAGAGARVASTHVAGPELAAGGHCE